MTFDTLGLSEEVLKAVADAGYQTPTPIQEQAIPYVLMGRDILGCAQTGTGKTASFTLPMIDILSQGRGRARMPRSLILTPTRELAAQVAENFEVYGKYHKLTMALLIGGESFGPQLEKLDRGVDVLIATPGRLIDHFERGGILLTDVKILVIDEADRMLDMGFIPDVERIVGFLPKIRQTLFFSATFPPEVKRLADKFLINPKEITVTPTTSAAETVEHFLVRTRGKDYEKREALRAVIRAEEVGNALIFCNRKRDVDVLARSLKRHGFSAAPLHGDMAQAARTETLDAFRAGKVALLVATDVAGRGIDVAGLSHVFNFDVPLHAEDYIHRIGRTGRAGMRGRAITLVSREDARYVAAIRKLLGKDIPELEIEGLEAEAEGGEEAAEAAPRGRRRGGRASPPRPRAQRRKGRAPEEPPAGAREAEAEAEAEKKTPAEGGEAREAAERGRRAKAEPKGAPREKRRGRGPSRAEDRAKERAGEEERKGGRGKEPVVGLGDHMPAFLARPPVPPGKKSSE